MDFWKLKNRLVGVARAKNNIVFNDMALDGRESVVYPILINIRADANSMIIRVAWFNKVPAHVHTQTLSCQDHSSYFLFVFVCYANHRRYLDNWRSAISGFVYVIIAAVIIDEAAIFVAVYNNFTFKFYHCFWIINLIWFDTSGRYRITFIFLVTND